VVSFDLSDSSKWLYS